MLRVENESLCVRCDPSPCSCDDGGHHVKVRIERRLTGLDLTARKLVDEDGFTPETPKDDLELVKANYLKAAGAQDLYHMIGVLQELVGRAET